MVEERISNFEGRSIGIIHSSDHEKIKIDKNEWSLRDLIKNCSVYQCMFHENSKRRGEREKGKKKKWLNDSRI